MNKARRRGPIPARRLVPNVLTTVALCGGMASVHFSMQKDFAAAAVSIGLAAVFDALDGRAARLLRASSRFGAVLDSLADFLSFGVAPAMLLYQWMLGDQARLGRSDVLGLAAVMTYTLCAALRLARFTAMPKSPPTAKPARYFVGLASPAAAGTVLVPVMIQLAKTTEVTPPEWVVVPWTFGMGLLMISRFPTYSIKAARVPRRLVVPLLVVVGLFVALAVKDFWLAVAVLCLVYLASIPLSVLERSRSARGAASGAPRAS